MSFTSYSCATGPAAIDILRKGLEDLQNIFEDLKEKLEASVVSGDYEHYPDVSI